MSLKENMITRYVKECWEELEKVVWPTKNQAIKLTGIVLVFVLLAALFLTFADYGFNWIYTYILTK
ncbi:MAG: preprotein translocase subunit SecE [Candidatus Gracilibacteria bacterium]|jgi:preprotein translocase subunit SecE